MKSMGVINNGESPTSKPTRPRFASNAEEVQSPVRTRPLIAGKDKTTTKLDKAKNDFILKNFIASNNPLGDFKPNNSP